MPFLEFTLYFDNNPLSYVMFMEKLNATGMCWIVALADYNFKVKYCPGKISNNCNFLSCFPIQEVLKSHSKEISLENLSSLILWKLAESNWLSVSAVNLSFLEKHVDMSLDYELKNVNPNLKTILQFHQFWILSKLTLNLILNKKGNLVETAGFY